MRGAQVRSRTNDPTVVAALVGGVFGIALWAAPDLLAGGGVDVPLDVVFVGSLLAGFLARRYGGQSRAAGISAAVIAVLPASLTVSEPVVYFLETYGIHGIGRATAALLLFVGFLLLVTVVIGALGGGIGGWVGNRLTARSAA